MHPITLNTDHELIAGFYRFNVAIELGWKKIKVRVVDVPKMDERYLEFEENWNRKNFTDYEVYVGLARLKRDYEKVHPETKQGKYIRSGEQNLKVHRDALMMKNIKSFIDEYHEGLGLQRRALFNKIRIGEAILQDQFDKRTLSLVRQGEISQNKLLQVLKRKKVRKETKKITKASSVPKLTLPQEDTKESEKRKDHTSINSEEISLDPKVKLEKNDDPIKVDLTEIGIAKKEETNNESKNEGDQLEKKQSCIKCKKARVSPCPNCLIQFIMCTDDLEKGRFVIKKADSKKCEEFEY